ncbi:MAG TPA: riboflavin synthase [Xanthobacteraceae bacterium]|jgi:riboflavin synthase|nr:riboflavin synthase [Xanthobacteraceae bacterium]
MFTGIVTDIGEVIAVAARANNLSRLRIACHYDRASIGDGASIACNGVCLTVVSAGVEDGRTWFSADAAAETLAVTTAGRWRHGTRLNLERALRIGDELGGHIVAGHVDGIAQLVAREDLTEMARLTFQAPPQLSRFIAPKGSVALDGVSLTVNEAKDDGFEVLIIPHTLEVTTFGALRPGDAVNLEVDLMARYAARLIERR